MLQRFLLLMSSALFFILFVSLVALTWYIALPVLFVLGIFGWWRARQVRKFWEKAFAQANHFKPKRQKPEIENVDVIDVEFEEL